jgi:flavin-dependent dehydrogenase
VTTIDATICVLGGGPAGSVIARGLAQLGYSTVMVERGVRSDAARVESLAPPVRIILDSLGLAAVSDGATLCRETQALVRWASDHAEVKTFDPPALLVERSRFDRLLRAAAAEAGTHALAGSAGVASRLPSGGWSIPVRSPAGDVTIRGAFLVDARGKRPRLRAGGARTAAIRGTFRTSDRSLTQTRIDAGAQEWLWGSPCADGYYAATLFIDARRLAGRTREQRRSLFLRAVSGSKLLHALAEAELLEPLHVRDATGAIADTLIGNDFIRVGEAAFAIDPLSSQGIQAALLSAVQGTAVVHTMLLGRDAGPAMDFYRTHQTKAAARAARNAAQHYQTQASHRPNAFWLRRSPLPEIAVVRARPNAASPSARMTVSPELQIVDVPVLSGPTITLAPALCHPGLDEPVGYFGGIALAPLVARLTTPSTPDEIVGGWSARMQPATAHTIVSWMMAAGILVPHGN